MHGGKASEPKRSRPGLFFKVKVQAGERIDTLAAKFDLSPGRLRAVNGLSPKRDLRPGTQILVPVTTSALRSLRIRRYFPVYSLTLSSPYHAIAPRGRKDLAWPIEGLITWGYGRRNGKNHKGIDVVAEAGSEIRSASRGKVEFVGWKNGFGWTVIVDHKSYKTLYAHCRKFRVKKNQLVAKGTVLGEVGKSGNAQSAHLHFEVHSSRNKAMDPLPHLLSSSVQAVAWNAGENDFLSDHPVDSQ